jgi:hypothetical protein
MGTPSRKHRNPVVAQRRLLVPHSPAWFAHLERCVPHQAAMTRVVLDRAGRVDTCSVCGDTPAPIFEDLDAPSLPIRLCAECLTIRMSLFGERSRHRDPAPREY